MTFRIIKNPHISTPIASNKTGIVKQLLFIFIFRCIWKMFAIGKLAGCGKNQYWVLNSKAYHGIWKMHGFVIYVFPLSAIYSRKLLAVTQMHFAWIFQSGTNYSAESFTCDSQSTIKRNNASPFWMSVSLNQLLGISPWWGCYGQCVASDDGNRNLLKDARHLAGIIGGPRIAAADIG